MHERLLYLDCTVMMLYFEIRQDGKVQKAVDSYHLNTDNSVR